MKYALCAVTVAIVVALLAWRISGKISERAASDGPRAGGPGGGGPVPIAVEPVRKATIRDVRLFTGTLQPNSEFHLAPKISGRLKTLTVELGAPIKRGQLIATLDADEQTRGVEQAQAELAVAKANAEKVRLDAVLEDEELAQKVLQAEAELGIAKANVQECESNLTVAKREFERAKTLRGKTIMSQSGLDEAEARYLAEKARKDVGLAQVSEREAALNAAKVRLSEDQKRARKNELRLAESQVAQKQAALRSAEVQLSYTEIHADWHGGTETRYVGDRFVDEGAMLTSSTPILTVVDITTLRAFIYVIERDYPRMRIGQKAAVTTDAYPGVTFTGCIARISQVLQETSRQGLVEVEIPNDDLRLKPGMFARLEIEFAKHADATVIPRAALVNHHGREGVFLADLSENAAQFVPVQIGIVNGTLAEVVDPPLDGSVVTLGQHLLSDGAAVVISTFEADAEDVEE